MATGRQAFDPYIPGYQDLRRTREVAKEMHRRAEAIAEEARASAPVDTGAYRASIEVEDVTTDRATSRVVARVPYAWAVEIKTRTLGRATDAGKD